MIRYSRVALESQKNVEDCTKLSLPCVKGGGPRSGGRIVLDQMLLTVLNRTFGFTKNNLELFRQSEAHSEECASVFR